MYSEARRVDSMRKVRFIVSRGRLQEAEEVWLHLMSILMILHACSRLFVRLCTLSRPVPFIAPNGLDLSTQLIARHLKYFFSISLSSNSIHCISTVHWFHLNPFTVVKTFTLKRHGWNCSGFHGSISLLLLASWLFITQIKIASVNCFCWMLWFIATVALVHTYKNINRNKCLSPALRSKAHYNWGSKLRS